MDVLLINGALLAAIAWRTDWLGLDVLSFVLRTAKWYITLSAVWVTVALLLDSYDLPRAASPPQSVIVASAAALGTVGSYTLIPWLTPPLATRGLIYAFAALAVVGVSAWRVTYALFLAQPTFCQHALVIGAGQAGQALARALQPLPRVGNPVYGTGYQIVGFLDDDPAKQGETIAGIPVLGTCQELPQWLASLPVDEIVLAITHCHTISPTTFEALLSCREQGWQITTMPVLYERLFGRVPVDHVGRDLYAVLPLEQGPAERLYLAVKRLGDILLGLAGLAALGIIAPPVALANRILCPGPLIYRQTRVGHAGKLFRICKFRTMIPNAEQETGAVWAADHDPRVTPVGRFLRATRLDELPQAWNVLRGEMSAIGPRPERPEFVAQLAAQIPFYRVRHAVRPGVTGWAQVRYRYGSSVDDARIKLEYDLYYVKHAGFSLDVQIVLKSVGVMVRMAGR